MTTMDIIRRTKAAWRSIHTMTAEDKSRLLQSMAERMSRQPEITHLRDDVALILAGLGGIAGRAAPRALFGGEPVQCHGLPFVLSLPTCRRGLGIFLEGYRRLNSHRLT